MGQRLREAFGIDGSGVACLDFERHFIAIIAPADDKLALRRLGMSFDYLQHRQGQDELPLTFVVWSARPSHSLSRMSIGTGFKRLRRGLGGAAKLANCNAARRSAAARLTSQDESNSLLVILQPALEKCLRFLS